MGDSPEWLRSFQVPGGSILSLSSDSNSSPGDSPRRESVSHQQDRFLWGSSKLSQSGEGDHDDVNESETKSPSTKLAKDATVPQKRKIDKTKKMKGNKDERKIQSEVNLWTLSSDSESSADHGPAEETNLIASEDSGEAKEAVTDSIGGTSSQMAYSRKSPEKVSKAGQHTLEKENGTRNKMTDEGRTERQFESHVPTSRLPLLLPEKVLRSKVLVECEGETIDVSGDMGAVGRIVIPDTSLGDHDMYFDLKGTVYKTTIVPSRTFCVVSFGQSEAKIEAIMNDFIQLKPQSNVYESETMVEGTMNGFSFDSEDDADKMPDATHRMDENGGINETSAGKQKRKAEKTSAVKQKKEKVAGGKPLQAKRTRKTVPVSRKTAKSRK